MNTLKVPHPYEAQKKWVICAWPNKDGTFILRGNTFSIKDKIKELKGTWNIEGKYWTVFTDAIKIIKPLIMLKVKVAAHCHEPEQIIFATHKEMLYGYMQLGCGMCDTIAICGDVVKILEIVDTDTAELIKEIYENKTS